MLMIKSGDATKPDVSETAVRILSTLSTIRIRRKSKVGWQRRWLPNCIPL